MQSLRPVRKRPSLGQVQEGAELGKQQNWVSLALLMEHKLSNHQLPQVPEQTEGIHLLGRQVVGLQRLALGLGLQLPPPSSFFNSLG